MSCEYCDSKKQLVNGFTIEAEIEDNKLLLYEKETMDSEDVPINFCPMCGRDLKGGWR